uniref:GDSL-type esterase/lipase family protein n=1 Tax=uncultured Draconibacterium sp. TaxID=1573823 RepID=UPI0032178780
MNLNRRNFFMKSAAGVAALATVPGIVSASLSTSEKRGNVAFNKEDIILFQGDSITDAGRDRNNQLPNNGGAFGRGYAFLTAANLLNTMPEENLKIHNRGISGNKVFQLADRWEEDCLDLKPNVLSILIGVNDYWHKRNGHYDGTIEVYENDYRALLQRTLKALPDIKLVLCEPFYVLETSAVDETWVEPMKKYQAAAKRISDEFNTIWVPFQKVFDEAIKHVPGTYWTGDGVHPSMAGAQLMAEAWLKAVGQ